MQDALHSNTLHKVAINILDGKEGLLVERYWVHLQVRWPCWPLKGQIVQHHDEDAAQATCIFCGSTHLSRQDARPSSHIRRTLQRPALLLCLAEKPLPCRK